jgi:hypothetical protein
VNGSGGRPMSTTTAKLPSDAYTATTAASTSCDAPRFQDHPHVATVLQTGLYLLEGRRPMRGLYATDPQSRTFAATDWRGHRVLGAPPSSLGLALADFAKASLPPMTKHLGGSTAPSTSTADPRRNSSSTAAGVAEGRCGA